MGHLTGRVVLRGVLLSGLASGVIAGRRCNVTVGFRPDRCHALGDGLGNRRGHFGHTARQARAPLQALHLVRTHHEPRAGAAAFRTVFLFVVGFVARVVAVVGARARAWDLAIGGPPGARPDAVGHHHVPVTIADSAGDLRGQGGRLARDCSPHGHLQQRRGARHGLAATVWRAKCGRREARRLRCPELNRRRGHARELGVVDVAHLVAPGVVAIAHAQAWHVRLVNVVACHAGKPVLVAHPVLLALVRETRHEHRVARHLAHITRRELPNLGGHTVLLDERLFGEVDLQRVVRAQRNEQPACQKGRQRVLVVIQEERVVGQGAHAQADLGEVEHVLQPRALAQIDAVRDVVGQQERGGQVVEVARLACVRAERESVQPLRLAEIVEHVEIGLDVVGVVGKRRVVRYVPIAGLGHVALRGPSFGSALVVHHVEAHDCLQEHVQLRVRLRVDGHLEERVEDVVDHLLEILQRAVAVVDFVQPRDLDHPLHVVAVQSIVAHPRSERVPFGGLAAIDGDAVLGHLVLGRHEVREHLLRQLSQVAALQEVVLFDEDFAQLALAARVVLQVELVEPVESVLVSVHVERVHVQVIAGQVEQLEHLCQRTLLPVNLGDDLIGLLAQLVLDEAQQVLLIHARAVVHVRVDLAHVVEVAMRRALLREELFVGIEHEVHVELLLKEQQAVVAEALHGARVDDAQHVVQVFEELVGGVLRSEGHVAVSIVHVDDAAHELEAMVARGARLPHERVLLLPRRRHASARG
mmetsp:Transcript_12255/g.51590  ORF Transcript_12255/g.51590 Transcript_12255/m.51590 type:complete len:756 (-) Transcript_12255:852-3119(-)